MRVLLANKFFHRNGGSETVLFQEREYLLNNNVNVIDFSMKDSRNEESAYTDHFIEEINYNTSTAKSKLKSAAAFIHSNEAVSKISHLADETQPDIAHLHNIYHQLTPSIIPALKKRGVKIVLTLHDTKLVCPGYLSLCNNSICDACNGQHFHKAFTQNCQNSRLKSLLMTLEAYFHRIKRSYNDVDQFIAPSQFLATKIMAGRPELGKVTVLRNGIDTNAIAPSHEDDGYILYFGRLSREKGVPTLIAAHQSIKNGPPLKIVGTGPLLEPLKADYRQIEFTGYKTGYELKELIAKAACVVVPSEWYENCSMVVLEAMAYGKPVIGSRIGGIPEQIEHGITGYLYTMGSITELAECMENVMYAAAKRKSMGAEARRKLEQEFSLEAHNTDLLKIYQQLLQS